MSKYWGVEEDELVLKWNTCTSQRQELEITNKLIPKINIIINNIVQSYFTINSSFDLKRDCLMYVLLKLKTTEIKPNQNIFGLIGFIIKNYLKNKTFLLSKADEIMITSTNYHSIDDTEHDCNFDVEDSDYTKSEDIVESTKAILSHLNDLKSKHEHSIKTKYNLYKKPDKHYVLTKSEQTYSDVLRLVIEFLEIDKDKWSLTDLYEYISNNISICQNTLRVYAKSILGIDYTYKVDNTKDVQTKIYKKYDTDYIDDDFTPNTYPSLMDIHRKSSKAKSNCIIKNN